LKLRPAVAGIDLKSETGTVVTTNHWRFTWCVLTGFFQVANESCYTDNIRCCVMLQTKSDQRLYDRAPKSWPESWPTLSATHKTATVVAQHRMLSV